MNAIDWLKEIMARHGGRPADLARALGRDRSVGTKILKQSRRISSDELAAIARYFGEAPPLVVASRHVGAAGKADVSSDDLTVVSVGEEFGPDSDPDLDGEGASQGEEYKGKIPGAQPEVDARAGAGQGSVGEIVKIESLGILSGHRVLSEWHFPASYLRGELRAPPNRTWVLEVVGDSMLPTLSPGDRVIIDISHQHITPDGVYVIDEGDGPMVKRLHRIRGSEPPSVEIISDNDHQPNYTMRLDQVRVIGRVCGRVSRM